MLGQTNYTEISSLPGPCRYPAGHLWHYSLFAWLFEQTEYAFVIMKLWHCFQASASVLLVGWVAYRYFRKPREAQLVLFMLMAQHELRMLHMDLYNDGAVGFYVYMAIASIVEGMSVYGIVALGLATSLKAPAILLLPAYLGCVQIREGTVALTTICVAIFIVIQVGLALPFVDDGIAKLLGFEGANTGWREYLRKVKIIDDGTSAVAYEHSMNW